MYEQRLPAAPSKSENKHQRIVQPEASHVVVAVEGTVAEREFLICLQETAVATVDVLDDELVAAVGQLVHHGYAVSCVETSNTLTMGLAYGRQGVVDNELEKQMIVCNSLAFKWLKRWQQVHPDSLN